MGEEAGKRIAVGWGIPFEVVLKVEASSLMGRISL